MTGGLPPASPAGRLSAGVKQVQRRLSADAIAELVEAYKTGRTLNELAAELYIHRTNGAEALGPRRAAKADSGHKL